MTLLAANSIYSNNSAYNSGVQFLTSGGIENAKTCKVYANFNSSGSINYSFNVSSVTINGLGDFTINFSNAASTSYHSSFSHCSADGEYGRSYNCVLGYYSSTSSSLRLVSRGSGPYGGRGEYNGKTYDPMSMGAFW